jgi:hypothetical protein
MRCSCSWTAMCVMLETAPLESPFPRALTSCDSASPAVYQVMKHWNLAAFPSRAAQTARWLLNVYGRETGVVMPRENPSTKMFHICSDAALSAAEKGCGGVGLGELPSPHSNRFVVLKGRTAELRMRKWLDATRNETEYLPSPVRSGGRWHTPEQCSFGLIDADCGVTGRSQLWFEYFFTVHHARPFFTEVRPGRAGSFVAIPVARSRNPPH